MRPDDYLKDIDRKLDKLADDVVQLRVDVGALKIKSGIWGLMGGLIPAIGATLMYLISKM